MCLISDVLSLQDLKDLATAPFDPVIIDLYSFRRTFCNGVYVPDYTPLGPDNIVLEVKDAESNRNW